MSDMEQSAQPNSVTPDTAATETQQSTSQPATSGTPTEAEISAAAAALNDDDLPDEIEIGGEKYEIPKKAAKLLQAERMMQADYTRKTQEVAEQRKAQEYARTQFESQVRAQQEFLSDYASLHGLQQQIDQYANVDWNGLQAQDMNLYLQHDRNLRNLQAQQAQVAQGIAQKQQQRALNEQQAFAKQIQEADAFLSREIPNWGTGRSNELLDYTTKQLGIPESVIVPMVRANPQIAVFIHKAEMLDRLQKQASQKPATPAAAPVAKLSVKSSSGSNKTQDEMTPAEWLAHRNKTKKVR